MSATPPTPSAAATTPGPAASARTALGARWAALRARERRLLALGAAVLGAYLVWALAVAPAWRTLARAPAERAALEAQWQTMQAQAAEAQALRAVAPVPPAQATAALTAATARLGSQGKLSLQGSRAVLTLQGVQGPQLAAWLAEARAGARAHVVEATLRQSGAGANAYDGSLVLAIGGPP